MIRIKAVTLVLFTMFWLGMKAQQPTVKFQNNSAEYAISWENKVAQINNLTPEIKINGKWVSAKNFKSIKWEEKQGTRLSEENNYNGEVTYVFLICEGHPTISNFTIQFEIVKGRPYLVMNSTLEASKGFKLGGIRLFNSSKENIVLPGQSKDWVIFNENAAAPHVGAIMYPYQLSTKKINQGSFSKADTGVWLSMLINDSKNQAFTFASIAGELWPNNFKWELPVKDDFNKLKLSARSGAIYEKEEIYVPEGKQIITDAFLVGFWDNQRPTQTLLETGVIMGQNVRKGKPMRMPEPGWSSWHSYARDISEEKIKSATDFIAENLKEYGWNMVQIDGGWWTQPGEYTVNKDFPNGMRKVSNYAAEKNVNYGLHISPLRINPEDKVLKQNPDWILKSYSKKTIDINDDEMVTTIGAEYVDTSHPSVAPFLTGRYQQMVEGYNPSFMKWDHHYGALEEGKRVDSTMTFLQSHNKTIRAIRSALPDDLIVTRSMGYLFGALESYDAVRIGNDINHPGIKSEQEPYANLTYGKTLGTIEDDLVGKGLIRFARQVAQNYYVHKNIAICDPDAFFVNPLYTVDEAKAHMTLQAIMGGLFFVGDRLETLPEDRLELLKNREIMAVNKLGVHAMPLDLFSGVDIPTVWKLETEDRLIITIFNWLDTEVTKTYNYKSDFELDSKGYKLTDLWTKGLVPTRKDGITLKQAPHSVKIMEFKK
ncbi:alpha-galactosidase [Polaribacter sp. BAL334]|uniref:alpha-galactosidase n=1 Tax=Polaribacter sp. BAL334 TaxID=1708178 RepID=UPI0018D23790|nr:alpha-galactosidase [Polaribacter sp. BAL334]MBG7613121.1 alpha-galactosidase [Polaribacter sp. BAL334]